MITIGICDDDSVCSNTLYNIINRVMFSINDWKAQVFHSSEEVIQSIENGDFNCQLIFMDIMIENGMGLKTARYICQKQLDTDIIFVTASTEHVFECYHYHAFAYLLKPISESDVTQELRRYMDDLQNSPNYLSVSFQGISHQIPIHSILYIESNLRKLTIHTESDVYYCYRKLNDIAEKLKDEGFVRCHQSYLVAIDKVHKHTTSTLYVGKDSIPVSSRYQTQLKHIFSTQENEERVPVKQQGLNQLQKNFGAIICIKGAYLGAMIRIRPKEIIQIGRDGEKVDMVVNLPLVSRIHCSILYHCDTMEYEVVDFSSNGTFVNGNKRLLPDETYLLKPGTTLSFGDKDTVYILG